MKIHLYKVTGYEEAIMSLRMSKGKFWSPEIAKQIQDLVFVVTDRQGLLAPLSEYEQKCDILSTEAYYSNPKITGDYYTDVEEFKRLLGLTKDNSMGEQTHHTLMKYITISFFTEGLHRGGQDDLDAHAIAFNNRITRFSTRLAEIDEQNVSDWYQDKLIPFYDVIDLSRSADKGIETFDDIAMPEYVFRDEERYVLTPFGYVKEYYANLHPRNGLRKDVMRGGMGLALPSNALWMIDLFNLRYVYHMRSKLTKAHPELRDALELIADQVEAKVPVFGEHFRYVLTDTKQWEHTNKTRTITAEEFKLLQQIKGQGVTEESPEDE